MAEEKKILEREYIIPLRRKCLHTPRYKKVPKAIKIVKQFIAKHMTLRDDDLRKVKIDRYLNEQLWFRGIRNPPAKIKVKAKKENGEVYVELVEMYAGMKFKKQREENKKKEAEKKKETKKVEEVKEEKTQEETKIEVEKEKSGQVNQELKAKEEHKEMKHETKRDKKQTHPIRMALKK